jgi:hypothetical protein
MTRSANSAKQKKTHIILGRCGVPKGLPLSFSILVGSAQGWIGSSVLEDLHRSDILAPMIASMLVGAEHPLTND